ncbi:MAG: Gfo/Idh/MocA family oxidoreductase [Elusimicrobiota bacterium]
MRKLKAGVLGLRRGMSYATSFNAHPNTQLVTICDFSKDRISAAKPKLPDLTLYSDYDNFLEHDTDIVVIAGYLPDHAKQAIKALHAGKHVLSEVTACMTLGEAVALCRTVEKTGKKYMMAENYCYMPHIQEMKVLYKKGVLGEYTYGEGEYIHDCRPQWKILTNGPTHWRNWLPASYYCTHSLGPISWITGTRTVKVNGFFVNKGIGQTVGRVGDDWGVLMCTMDNGAISRIIPWSNGPRDTLWYRIYGTKGTVEHNRLTDKTVLNVFTETKPLQFSTDIYLAKFKKYADLAAQTGHGGSDFFVTHEFVESILKDTKPPIDVYESVDMTLPGILGYKSALMGNASLEVPDFRKESVRKKYENDNWSPNPADKDKQAHQPKPSILGDIKIPVKVYKQIYE